MTYSPKELVPGLLESYTFLDNNLIIRTDRDILLHVSILESGMIRFRFATQGIFPNDFSYAIDPKFSKDNCSCDLEESDSALLLKTEQIKVRIEKENLHTTILNHEDLVLSQDEKGFHWEESHENGGDIVQMSKKVQLGEAYYGLGDKPTSLNLRAKRLSNWGTDSYGFTESWDPLYKNIPFYYGLHHGEAYGIFFDNSFKTYFDFAMERHSASSFWAHGGEMNYYFFYGPQLMDVCKAYTRLTGRPELPPMWALGYQQSKWSYYPESNIKEITGKFRALSIPCDVIHIDIDYMDGFRCFTWDPEKFPDPKRMIAELKANGFKTVVIIDPGIKLDHDYWVFKEALEQDFFCKRADGPYIKGEVWPGDCYFPDFTKPEAREWWSGLYKGLIEEQDVAGVWNDMNEPALFEVESKTFPDDVRHDYDGNPCSHRKAHNVYGMQMTRATYNGLKKYGDGKRPLSITRSGYSGVQRFSSVWTGDNVASWEHIHIANIQCQRLAISGVSFAGSDVGGFIEQPDGELYTRWVQMAVFHSFFRTHSSGDHGEQEPWSFGDTTTDLVRRHIELRYQLLPYFYTTFQRHVTTDTPFITPMIFFDQHDEKLINRENEFIVGDHILVSPVRNPGVDHIQVYLPKGKWYHYYTHELYEGKNEYDIATPLEYMPFFIKAGAVIPHYPIQQYVDQIKPEKISLHIYLGEEKTTSNFYEDGHDYYQYENGDFVNRLFTTDKNGAGFNIDQSIEGTFKPTYHLFDLKIMGIPNSITRILIDGKKAQFSTNDKNTLVEDVPVNFKTIELV